MRIKSLLHRRLWLLAFGLLAIIAGIIYVVAFRPIKPIDFRPNLRAAVEKHWPDTRQPKAHEAVQRLIALWEERQELEESVLVDAISLVGAPKSDPTQDWFYIEPGALGELHSTDPDLPQHRLLLLELLRRADAADLWSRTRALSTEPAFARRMETIRWDTDSDDLVAFSGPTRSLTQLLFARMNRAYQQRDDRVIADSFVQVFGFERCARSNGLMIDFLIADAIVMLAEHALSPNISAYTLNADALGSMLDAVNSAAQRSQPHQCLTGEAVYMKDYAHRTLADLSPSDRLIGAIGNRPSQHAQFDAIDDYCTTITTELSQPGAIRISASPTVLQATNELERITGHSMSFPHAFDLLLANRATLGRLRLLLAVELHRATHDGIPPASLDALVPDILLSLPIDPYAPDHRFRYRVFKPGEDPHARAYLLYSVGADAIDNNATPPSPPTRAIDDEKARNTDHILNLPARTP